MITAIDTNVLLDLFIPTAPHGKESEAALGRALEEGTLIISDVVYAEIAGRFNSQSELDAILADTGVEPDRFGREGLYLAGQAWREYARRWVSPRCPQCGSVQDVDCNDCGTRLNFRQHLVADFLVGAHAITRADRLMTRDRGFYSAYFPDLRLF